MSTTTNSGPRQPGGDIPANRDPDFMPQPPDPIDELPLDDRLGRDPSNLGDDVRDDGDLVFPNPEPPTNNL
jgi:hypothetical protein